MSRQKDSRSFKRYSTKSKLSLKINSRIYKAVAVDYSLEGIGAVIGSNPGIVRGDIVDLNPDDPESAYEGEVVWCSMTDSGLRIGINKIGVLRGRLRDFGLTETLLGLQRGHKTGVLSVSSSGSVKKIYIKNGDIISSVSDRKEDRLEDMLLRKGKISSEQYKLLCGKLKADSSGIGALLVRLGILKPAELLAEVRGQMEEIILDIFALADGSFGFEEMPLPKDEIVALRLSAANLIYRGIKRISDPKLILKDLPPPESFIRLSPEPINLFQDMKLDETGPGIISSLKRERKIRDLVLNSGPDSLEVFKTIYALLSIKVIQVIEPRDIKGADHPPDNFSGRVIEEREQEAADPQFVAMIEETHLDYRNMGYYGILGVDDSAPDPEIRNAYFAAAKRFHPDIHFHYADESLKAKLGDIFSFVHEAYSILSSPAKRSEYDKSLGKGIPEVHDVHNSAREKFEEGLLLFRKQSVKEAELLFGQAAYFDDHMADYHFYYGLALMRQDRSKEAEKALIKAYRLDPERPDCLAELGHVYMALGLPVRAKGFFHKALRISPDNARAMEGIRAVEGQ